MLGGFGPPNVAKLGTGSTKLERLWPRLPDFGPNSESTKTCAISAEFGPSSATSAGFCNCLAISAALPELGRVWTRVDQKSLGSFQTPMRSAQMSGFMCARVHTFLLSPALH